MRCEAWIGAGNQFIEVEYVKEGEGPNNENDKGKVAEKAEKAGYDFIKRDRAKFINLTDELSNDLSKGVNSYLNNIAEATQLAQNHRIDDKVLGDLMVPGLYYEEAYYSYGRSYKEKLQWS